MVFLTAYADPEMIDRASQASAYGYLVKPFEERELHATLKPGGVLFSSNPHGHNEEGWSGERYGVYHDLKTWRGYLCAAGFVELDHYYRPTGLPREQQPWLAIVWRRDDSLDRHSPSRT